MKVVFSAFLSSALLLGGQLVPAGAQAQTQNPFLVPQTISVPKSSNEPYLPGKFSDPGLKTAPPSMAPKIDVPEANIPLKENPCALRISYWDQLPLGYRTTLRGCVHRYYAGTYSTRQFSTGNILPDGLLDFPHDGRMPPPNNGANLFPDVPQIFMLHALCHYQLKSQDGRLVNLYSKNAQECEAAALAMSTRMPLESHAVTNITIEDLGFEANGMGYVAGNGHKELFGGTFRVGILDFN